MLDILILTVTHMRVRVRFGSRWQPWWWRRLAVAVAAVGRRWSQRACGRGEVLVVAAAAAAAGPHVHVLSSENTGNKTMSVRTDMTHASFASMRLVLAE